MKTQIIIINTIFIVGLATLLSYALKGLFDLVYVPLVAKWYNRTVGVDGLDARDSMWASQYLVNNHPLKSLGKIIKYILNIKQNEEIEEKFCEFKAEIESIKKTQNLSRRAKAEGVRRIVRDNTKKSTKRTS